MQIKKQDILIVEDDNAISQMLYEALTLENYGCTQAYSGTEALLQIERNHFQLILLDLMLPGISGEELVSKLKEKTGAAIIVLSAKDALDTKVELLTMGADDYLTKPFALPELLARIQVQLRHYQKENVDRKNPSFQNLSLDPDRHLAIISQKEIPLTVIEYNILELLLSYPTKIFSKQEIYQYAWDDFYLGEDKTINVHISNIRQKIKHATGENWIKTVWGVGFTLVA